MASTPESLSTTQVFKARYVNGVRNPVPTSVKLQRMLDFKSAEKLGDSYKWSVALQLPQGHSWNGGASYGNAITLNDAQAGKVQMATAKGCEYYNRTQMPIGLLSKGKDGGQVVDPVMDQYMARLVEATAHGLEMQTAYGGTSIATIETVGSLATATFVATISKAAWAAGLWKCSENMLVDIYEAGVGDRPGATKRTATGGARVTLVNTATRQLTIVLAAAGDYSGIAPTDVIVPFNAVGNWTSGLDDIISTSASGANELVLGINPSTTGLWRASTFGAAGALSMTKFLQATAQLSINSGDAIGFRSEEDAEKRAADGDFFTFVCSPYTLIDLATEQAALRRYTSDSEIKKMRAGSGGVIFETPAGPVRVESSNYIKAGQGFFLRESDWHYVGSSMPTFDLPGREELLYPINNTNVLECQRYYDLGVIADVLNSSLKVTGIVNASL